MAEMWLQPPARAGPSLADFSSVKMGQYVPPKRRSTQDLHGATSQKTTFFVVTPVKILKLTLEELFVTPYVSDDIHNCKPEIQSNSKHVMFMEETRKPGFDKHGCL
jgi:hypothetical protein